MGQARVAPLRVGQMGVLLAGAVVGLVAGLQPLLGIALALAAVYVVLTVSDLAVGVALFVVVSFLESSTAFGGISLAKAGGGLLFLAWIGFVATHGGQARQLLRDRPGLVALLVCFGAWTAMTALWAEAPGLAISGSQRWILNLALFPVVYSAMRTTRHVELVFGLFVAGALLSAVLGLVTGAAASTTDDVSRLSGSGVNANQLGELLIVAVVLAGTLGSLRRLSSPARAAYLAAAGAAAVLLLMTFSRGALVGLIVALAVAPFLIGPGRRVAAVAAIVVALVIGGGYLAFFAPAADVQRLTQGDTSGSGRTDIWRVGLRMVQAHPVVGIGVDNFAATSVRYLLVPGAITRSDYIVDEPKPAHNVYLSVLAETGIVGLLGFLSIIALALRAVLRAARRFRLAGDRDTELLARGLLIGLCGLLASAFFSTAVYSKQLWLLLAMTAALSALSVERGARRAP